MCFRTNWLWATRHVAVLACAFEIFCFRAHTIFSFRITCTMFPFPDWLVDDRSRTWISNVYEKQQHQSKQYPIAFATLVFNVEPTRFPTLDDLQLFVLLCAVVAFGVRRDVFVQWKESNTPFEVLVIFVRFLETVIAADNDMLTLHIDRRNAPLGYVRFIVALQTPTHVNGSVRFPSRALQTCLNDIRSFLKWKFEPRPQMVHQNGARLRDNIAFRERLDRRLYLSFARFGRLIYDRVVGSWMFDNSTMPKRTMGGIIRAPNDCRGVPREPFQLFDSLTDNHLTLVICSFVTKTVLVANLKRSFPTAVASEEIYGEGNFFRSSTQKGFVVMTFEECSDSRFNRFVYLPWTRLLIVEPMSKTERFFERLWAIRRYDISIRWVVTYAHSSVAASYCALANVCRLFSQPCFRLEERKKAARHDMQGFVDVVERNASALDDFILDL